MICGQKAGFGVKYIGSEMKSQRDLAVQRAVKPNGDQSVLEMVSGGTRADGRDHQTGDRAGRG